MVDSHLSTRLRHIPRHSSAARAAQGQRVRLRDAGRCFQHAEMHGPQRVVNAPRTRRRDRAPRTGTVRRRSRRFGTAAPRPLGHRMLRDIPMQNPTRADLQHHEHVQGRNVAVTATKKSQASVLRAWFRTNVLQVCGDEHGRGETGRCMYRLTVGGGTPNLSSSSAAIRSSPHVRLARAMSAIMSWRYRGIRGRPGRRDVQRQNRRNPCRCTPNERVRSHDDEELSPVDSRASTTSAILAASFRRRGLTFRSI